jgi:hypothetical protein
MKLLDVFQGIMIVRPYPSMHLGFIYFIWKLTGSWLEDIKPEPNQEFVTVLNWFFYVHWLFLFGFLIQIILKNYRKELQFSVIMVATLMYLYLFLDSCLVHIKHSLKKGYALYQVEDVVHFFVIIEIVNYASTLLVNIIVLFFASCRNYKQFHHKIGMPPAPKENHAVSGGQ